MKFALGVDFSTKALHCAYGEPDAGRPTIVKVPITGEVAEDWIGSVADKFGVLLDHLETLGDIEVSFMVIERPFYSSNPRTTLKLAQIQSAAICTAHTHQWVCAEVDPSAIRKDVLGVGSSRVKGEMKRLAMAWAATKYGQELDNDESDAVVIWEHSCRILKQYS